MSEKDTPKGHFVIGKNTKTDGKFKLVFCTSCGQTIRIIVPKKKRANKHKRLLNAILEHIKVEFGNLVIGDIFISMDDKTTKEIIKIKESMK